MANEDQVYLIKQGYQVWNSWRQKNAGTHIDLSDTNLENLNLKYIDLRGADLRRTRFGFSNLSFAYFSRANLKEADFRYVDLYYVHFDHSNLSQVNFSGATLAKTDLRFAKIENSWFHTTKFFKSDLRKANLQYSEIMGTDFGGSDLSGANLNSAYLPLANLNWCNLSNANFSNANLYGIQAIDANFKGSTLTGACIADWQIGHGTSLDAIVCDCVFRTYDHSKREFTDRLPIDPKNRFAPGEFTKRFQIIASTLETIDITFIEGIDWQAFFQSFQGLKRQYPAQNIAVQGMEEKGGAFIVHLKVEAEETGAKLEQLKANIETTQKQLYSAQLALREAQGEIKVYREMMGVVKTLAGRPMGDQHFHAPVGNVAQTNQGKIQNIQHIYAPEQKDLSEAATEIYGLLSTLAETYNTTTDAGKEKLMKELSQEVKQHPKWRRALKEGGIELIKVLCAPIGVPLEIARVYLEEE